MTTFQQNLYMLKDIFTSKYWLIVSLCGAFFTFYALNRGGVVVFIEACFVILIINILAKEYQLKHLPNSYWLVIATCAYLLCISVIFHFQISYYRWMANIIRMLIVVLTIHCLSEKKLEGWSINFFFGVVAIAVCWQSTAYYVFKMKYGTFTNAHYLSVFTMLSLPIFAFAIMSMKRWYRYLFVPVILINADLLLSIESRPAFIALTVGTIFGILSLNKSRKKWIYLSLLCVLTAAILFLDYGGVYSRFENFIDTWSEEGRLKRWQDALNMLKDNSVLTWIIGNGIGSYRLFYLKYLSPGLSHQIFPHMHFLEILYENGIIAAVLLFGGFLLLFVRAIKFTFNTPHRNGRILVQCLIVMLLSWVIHAGLTFPFYSKYSLYSLAFIIGTLLAVLEKPVYKKIERKS